MKHIWLVVLAACLVFGPSLGFADYLVRIDGTPATGIPVNEKIDGSSLTFVHDLASLANIKCPYRILDAETDEALYLLVYPHAASAAMVAEYGTILDYYENCFLLKTLESRIPDLNGLAVEISRVHRSAVQTLPQPDLPQMEAVLVDTLIQQMVARVSSDSILAMDSRMQHFYTRYSTHDSNRVAAVNWIRDKYTAYNCDTVYTQQFSNTYGRNIIGVKRGDLFPSLKKYVLVGGHMDDVPSSGYAPGADDNASGTVAGIEACRVLRNFSFENTIVYAGWNAEEQGLIGSDSFAHRAQRQNDTILGVINFDMIGYVASAGRDSMNAHYTTAVPGCSLFVCRFFQAMADTYTQLKIRQVRNTGTSGSSDHASFWHSGYLALLGIERVLCPGYHTTGDTIGPSGFNNLAFATKVIQTGVAAVAKLAVPIHAGGNVAEQLIGNEPIQLAIQPNPGRDFRITFTTSPSPKPVRLIIYDAAGRLVEPLYDGHPGSGNVKVNWSGLEHAPGVYFLKCDCGDVRQVRKIILLP